MRQNDRPPFFARIVLAIFDWNARRQDRRSLHPINYTPWLVYLFWRHEERHEKLRNFYFRSPSKLEPFTPTLMTQEFHCAVVMCYIESVKVIEVATEIVGSSPYALYNAQLRHETSVRNIEFHPDLADYRPSKTSLNILNSIKTIRPGPIVIK